MPAMTPGMFMPRRRTRFQRSKAKSHRESLQVRDFNEMERLREKELFHSAAPINPRIQARRQYYATLPVMGFCLWWKISNHYVEISRYTTGRTMTAVVMSRMQ
jgi:hypothetical protein